MMLCLYIRTNARKNCSQTRKKTHLGKPMEKTRFYPWSFRNKKKTIRQSLLEDSKPDDHPPRYAYNGKVNFTSILWDVTLHDVFFQKQHVRLIWHHLLMSSVVWHLDSTMLSRHVRYMGEPQLTIWRVEFWDDVLLVELSIHKTESGGFT